jgi:hypothetical protein
MFPARSIFPAHEPLLRFTKLSYAMRDDFYSKPITIIFNDDALNLTDVQPFSRQYSVQTGSEVRIIHRWAGPAAGPAEWSLVEVAVIVVLTYDVINLTVHVSQLVRDFLTRIYSKIRTETGARIYVNGALAVAIENDARTLRVLFCLPRGLSIEEVNESLDRIRRDAPSVLATWEATPWAMRGASVESPFEMRVVWDPKNVGWRPTPEEREATLREYGQF